MGYTIPDKGEGDNDIQSILFQEDLDILAAGMAGIDCVLSGLAVTGGADMTPAVAKGAVLSNRVMFAIAAADVTIGTADATHPRIDLIAVDSAGTLRVRAGTPAAAPKPPARSTNDVVIAFVYVPAGDTAIGSTQIIDKRVTPPFPVTIYRTTTAEVTNNTLAAVYIVDKANSGLVIPNGLLTTGRILRVRVGGNILFNSGSPTLILAIVFGGTTMFQDTSVASAADGDRRAWMLDFMIIAQANNDQALFGALQLQPLDITVAAAASAGIGDFATSNTSNRLGTVPFAGSAAVDADAANRTLQVSFAMSVQNANDEIVVEGATVELM